MPNRFVYSRDANFHLDYDTDVCISLGAGNAIGMALKTNLVKRPKLSERFEN